METQNVFVSSTWIDMIPEREAVEQAAVRLRSVRFIGMEHFGARSGTTRAVSLEEVDRGSIYLGVIGHRWGSGITEAEYRRARERRLPCLVYFKAGDPLPGVMTDPDAERLALWKSELAATHTVVTFTSPLELAARISADLHNLLLDQLVGQDLGLLAHEHRSRIQNFVAEYLGSAQAPVPFGGRDRELADLDGWLADSRAPPYAMLAGPAGRGKSALLVHWAQRQASLGDLALIFFPISIRFETNLAAIAFASITARLAQLHGEPLLAGPDTPVDVWREMMAAYLRRPPPQGRRLLLILDGADESADWKPGPDLFPAAPVEGLRVLVSARYQPGDADARGWIARLGWNRSRLAWPIDLAPLSPSGLADVLRQSSLPLEMLSERADVVAELFRLSGGDPLVIQLYVADLLNRGDEAARLRPEDLGAHQPGLAGYFAVWWEEQGRLWGAQSPLRQTEFEQVFNALACALGPLRSDELLELMPGGPVGSWALDEVMRSLRRFVVGDGSAQGYAFSHPRLAEYFYDILANRGRQREQELRFVTWGRQCLQELAAGRRRSAEVPAYLLQFLRPHFERADCGIEDWLGLGSTAWAEAWERVDKGSWSGFLADLRELRKVAVTANDHCAARGVPLARLGTELRAALFSASIGTQASEMPVVLLGALLRRGVWAPNQAIAYATRIRDPRARMLSLLTVVALTPEVERPLALAAALGDLRNLLAVRGSYGRPDGDDILRDLLREIAQQPAGTEGARHAARLLDAAARLCRQGLPAEQRESLRSALEQAVLGAAAQSPAQRLLNLTGAAAALVAERVEPERMRALDELARAALLDGRALPSEALDLLQRALPAQPQLLLPALCAATWALTDDAVVHERCDDSTADLLAAAWKLVPPAVAQGSCAQLATVLDAAALEHLLGHIAEQPPEQRARRLEDLLDHVRAPLRARVAGLRAQAAPTPVPDPAAPASVPGWLDALHEEVARDWFGQAADRMAGAALGLPHLAWLLDVFHARTGTAWRLQVAERALGLLDRLVETPHLVDVLATLVDALEAADGGGNALEDWRAPPPFDQTDDDRHLPFKPRAGALLRPLLSADGLARAAMRAATRAVALSPSIARLRQRHADLERRIDRLAGSTNDTGRARPALGPAARDLAERHAAEAWAPGELAHAALDAHDRTSPAASIALLCEVDEGVGRGLVWQAIGAVFDEMPEWRADVLLTANPTEPLPLPDFASDALLVRALGGGAQLQRQSLATLLHMAARLPSPTDDLVSAMLGALSADNNLTSADRVGTLKALAVVLRPPQWPRWLDAALDLYEAHRPLALQTLQQFASDRQGFQAELLAAVAKVRMPAHRLDALLAIATLDADAAPLRGTLVLGAAIAIARALPDTSARLTALDLIVRRLPRDRRAPVLAEALKLTRQVGEDRWPATSTLNLVREAVALRSPDPSLLQEAVEAAITIGDRNVRGQALAVLAEVLSVDALSDALAQSQRIADVAARLRTMRRFVQACAPSHAAAAADVAWASVQILPAGAVRNVATLCIAPLSDAPALWDTMGPALGQLVDPRNDITAVELLDALAPALVDAPAPLLAAALDAMRRLGSVAGTGRQAALVARSRVLQDLMPVLPRGLGLPALVQIAECPPAGAARALAMLWCDRELAAARRHGDRLPADAQALLAAMAAVRVDWARDPFDRVAAADSAPSIFESHLRRARNDVDRAMTVRRFAMLREPAPIATLLPVLARAALSIGDDVLRAAVVRSLAVHAELRSAEDAIRIAAAAAAIEPAGESALALLQLAQRQTGRVQEKTLTIALARAAAEAEPRRRLLAVVEVAIASPLRWPAVLELVQQVVEAETRAIALRRLLDGGSDRLVADVVASVPGLLPGPPGIAVVLHAAARRTWGPLACAALLAVAKSTPGAVARARLLAAATVGIDAALQADAAALLDGIGTDFAWLESLTACCARWPELLVVAHAQRAGDALALLGDDDSVTGVLRKLAGAWPAEAWSAYAKATLALGDDAARCAALCAAFEALGARSGSPAAPASLLTVARALYDPQCRAIALGRAAHVAAEPDEDLLAEALQSLDRCEAPLRIDALVGIGEGASQVAAPVFARLLDEFVPQPLAALQAATRLASRLHAAQAAGLVDRLTVPALRSAPHALATLLLRLAPVVSADDLPQLLSLIPDSIADELAASRLLAQLAPCITGEAAQSAAWDAACALRNPTPRADALIELAGRFAPERQRALLDALADTPLQAERARRLGAVRDQLDAAVLPHWQAAAASVLEPAMWAPQVPAPEPHVTRNHDDDDVSDALLDELTLPRRDAERPDGVPSPRRSAPLGELTGLLERLRCIESEADREQECRRSLPLLAADARLALIASLSDCFAPERAEALWLSIAPSLPMPQARQLLPVVVASHSNPSQFATRLAALPLLRAPELRADWLPWLRNTLSDQALEDRATLLGCLERLAPLIVALGGDETAAEVVEAIADAASLWP